MGCSISVIPRRRARRAKASPESIRRSRTETDSAKLWLRSMDSGPPRFQRVSRNDNSKQIQILVLLPRSRVRCVGVRFLCEARVFGFLDVGVVVGEPCAEARAQHLVRAERRGSLAQRLRQGRSVRFVGRIGGGTGIEL